MCPFSRVMQAKRGPCKRLHYTRARGAGRVVGNSPGKSRPPEAAAFPPRKSRACLARCGGRSRIANCDAHHPDMRFST